MNTYDTLVLVRLRGLPMGVTSRRPRIPLARLSDRTRTEVDDLLSSLERRSRLRGSARDVRADVLALLGIVGATPG